eukprot:7388008-Prymnesium_polylepis.1
MPLARRSSALTATRAVRTGRRRASARATRRSWGRSAREAVARRRRASASYRVRLARCGVSAMAVPP